MNQCPFLLKVETSAMPLRDKKYTWQEYNFLYDLPNK